MGTCDSSCSSECDNPGTTKMIADGIKFLSGHSYSTGGVLSQSSLDSALAHGPVVIGVQWSLGGGHAITISGGSGGNYKGHDPEGYAINTNYAGLTTYRPPYPGTASGHNLSTRTVVQISLCELTRFSGLRPSFSKD